jgi:hypothetical protein
LGAVSDTHQIGLKKIAASSNKDMPVIPVINRFCFIEVSELTIDLF